MNEENKLPKGWVQTTLGEICSKPQYGWTTKANPKSGSVRLLRTTDISGGLINWDTVPYCTEIPENLADYKLEKDDIVISRAGSVGVSYLLTQVPSETVFASYLIRFRPLEGVEPRYMAYYLQTPTYWASIYEQSSGIALANVNARKLEAFEIPLAPTNEQHRIVEAIEQQFTRLDASVAALNSAKTKLKRYRAAVLKAAVEGKLTEAWRAEHPVTEPASMLLERILKERRAKWEADLRAKGKDPAKVRYVEPAVPDVESLPELPEGWCWTTVEQVGNVQLGRQRAPQHHNGKFMRPYLRVANVFEDRIDTSDILTMNFTPEEFETYCLKFGDILLNEGQSLELIGRPAMYRDEVPGACFQNTLVRFRAHPPLLPEYALTVFRVYMHTQRFQRIGKHTTNIAHLGAGRFAVLEFPLPPLAEQEQIVAEVERRLSVISQLETAVEANLKRAERLRQSILRETFAGRLVPQDPNDEPASVLLERIRGERGGERDKGERKNGTGASRSKSNRGRAVKVPEPGGLDVRGMEVGQVELWEGVGG